MKAAPASYGTSSGSTMLTRTGFAGLRAVPAFLRTANPQQLTAAAAAARAPVSRRYASITAVAAPTPPSKSQPQQGASFASSAVAGIPYTELSVGALMSALAGVGARVVGRAASGGAAACISPRIAAGLHASPGLLAAPPRPP